MSWKENFIKDYSLHKGGSEMQLSPWNSLDPLHVPSSRNSCLDTLVDGLPKAQGCDSLFCVWGMALTSVQYSMSFPPCLNAGLFFLLKPSLHYPTHHCETCRPPSYRGFRKPTYILKSLGILCH